MNKLILSIPLLIAAQVASADPAAINSVRVSKEGGLYKFGDTGWDHFSDAWRILDTDGNQLAIRELIHPHVEEQPLTRSLSGVELPAGTTEVRIQVRETQSGWGKKIRKVQIK